MNSVEKQNRAIIIMLIGTIMFLFLEIGYTLYHLHSYEAQKELGNQKWEIVNERLLEMEKRIDSLVNN